MLNYFRKWWCIYFLGLLFLVLAYDAEAGQCTPEMEREYNSLTHEQHIVLAEAYLTGYKDDLGFTMMAIAYAESRAGKYLINTQTNDFGVMGISLKTASSREGIKGAFSRNILAQRLIFDNAYNMKLSLDELRYWTKYHKGDWRSTVSSYNAGFNVKAGKDYLTKIVKYTRMFMNC